MTTNHDKPYESIAGDATSPQGFLASGIHSGIKQTNKDLALLVSEPAARVAATFTLNSLAAAPVRLCRERLASGSAAAIVINSGNANACTGEQGMHDAQRMAQVMADALGVKEQAVFVCSTGLIGETLPMDVIEPGIANAVAQLGADQGQAAAEAIMTTDASPKVGAVRLSIDGTAVTVGGMAKGAGMIEPHMATMLAFLTTDAAVQPDALQRCLSRVVEASFNRISVDASTSTNDSVFLLANGVAGNAPLDESHPDWQAFEEAVRAVALDLAWKIVQDGEGATKFVTVNVTGAADDDDAQKVARAVANSVLVKTSWYGGDPNWGRLADAVGYSGAAVEESRLSVRYDDSVVLDNGTSDHTRIKEWEQVLARDRFSVNIDLGQAAGVYTIYTCDCTEEYVRFNSAYQT